jgi:hypothetical protein
MSSLIASLLKPILTLFAAWFTGKSAGKSAAKIEELKGYAETSKRINSVGPVPDPDAAAEWLRRRAERQRDL